MDSCGKALREHKKKLSDDILSLFLRKEGEKCKSRTLVRQYDVFKFSTSYSTI